MANGSTPAATADADFSRRTPDDDLPPLDRRQGAAPAATPPQDFSAVPDHDDGPETLAEDIRRDAFERRDGTPPVTWAEDERQPDFAHLLAAGQAGITPQRLFKLTPGVLDLLIRANSFNPKGPDGLIVFALRGGMLATGTAFEGQPSVEIEDKRPNHRDFCCTIGFYDRQSRTLSAYLASTVPNAFSMQSYYRLMHGGSGRNANMMPTGCYPFRVNQHKQGTIRPALRMTDPARPTEDAVMTVLRTHKDLAFTHDDYWHQTQPFDNVHCAYDFKKFSSAGCLTIQGTAHDGPWRKFQKVLETLGWDTRIDVLLLTGRDAAIAAEIIAQGKDKDDTLVARCLGRLRLGSEGPAVADLQKRLGFAGTGYFGSGTRLALVKKEQTLPALASDSIYSPGDDAAFGWDVLKPGFMAAGGGAALPETPASPGQVPAPVPGGGAPAVGISLNPDSLVLLSSGGTSTLSPNGKSLIVPGEGTWTVGPEAGRLSFTPEPGFTRSPSPVRYQISDSLGQSATASLSVTVQPANKLPVLAPDTGMTAAGAPVVIAVLANDTDLDGTIIPGSVRFKSMPQGATVTADGKTITVDSQGVWTVVEGGSIRFAPFAGYTGTASVTYLATDDKGGTGEGLVTVSVVPGAGPPRPADDSATVPAGSPITVDVLANDLAGAPIGQAPPPATPGPAPVTPAPQVPASTPSGPASGPATAPTPPSGQPAPTVPEGPPLSGIVKIDAATLRRLAPGGKEKYISALAQSADRILAEYGINANPLRLCHFMGQIAHESGGFTVERESLFYTTARQLMTVWPKRFPTIDAAQPFLRDEKKLAEKVYFGRLGNTQPGDGYLYRGRGFIQITGREAYREKGKIIGVDLEGNPDLACDPLVALKIAAVTWARARGEGRSLNQLADDNKIEAITRAINGGYTNLSDRRECYRRAWSIWGAGAAPVSPKNPNVLERGDTGPRVEKLQQLLVRAGYFPPDEFIDGRFGGNTQKTVMRFQLDHKLNVNGVVDAATWEALEKAPAATQPPATPAGVPAEDKRRGVPPSRRLPDAGPQRRHEAMRIAAVILMLMAMAAFILLRMRAESSSSPLGLELAVPALMVLAALILYITAVSREGWRRRRARLDAGPAPGERSLPHEPAASQPVPAPPAAPAQAARDFRDTDTKLLKLGFDDSYFADAEPVRAMPAQPETVDIAPVRDPGTQARPGLLPEDSLPDADAPAGPRLGRSEAGVVPFPVSTPAPAFVLISMFGGDNNLSAQVKKDLDEMAAGAARYGNVAVLALADTETGPGTIVEVTPQGQIRTLEHLGEIDTGDPATLAKFLARALVTYPTSRKAIGFWDHGTGVFQEGDPSEVLLDRAVTARRGARAPARRLLIPAAQRQAITADPGTRAMLHDNSGGVLTNLEAGRMLRAAFNRAGQDGRIDLIYSDTCLNGMIEVIEELSDFAHCVVASCDTEPPAGWDYEEWIRRMAFQVPQDPSGWARHAVQAFGASYQGQTKHYPCTLSAYLADNEITETFAALVAVAETSGLEAFSMMNLARSRCQGYDNRDSYDLPSFAATLAQMTQGRTPRLSEAAIAIVRACQQARVETVALGPTVGASEGLAFWFPSSARSLELDVATYERLRFNRLTNWARYLRSMYQGTPMG